MVELNVPCQGKLHPCSSQRICNPLAETDDKFPLPNKCALFQQSIISGLNHSYNYILILIHDSGKFGWPPSMIPAWTEVVLTVIWHWSEHSNLGWSPTWFGTYSSAPTFEPSGKFDYYVLTLALPRKFVIPWQKQRPSGKKGYIKHKRNWRTSEGKSPSGHIWWDICECAKCAMLGKIPLGFSMVGLFQGRNDEIGFRGSGSKNLLSHSYLGDV